MTTVDPDDLTPLDDDACSEVEWSVEGHVGWDRYEFSQFTTSGYSDGGNWVLHAQIDSPSLDSPRWITVDLPRQKPDAATTDNLAAQLVAGVPLEWAAAALLTPAVGRS